MVTRSLASLRIRLSGVFTLVASVVASAAPSTAVAQTRADVAQASALFAEGRRALAAHDETRACAAFRESLALDVEVGTLLNVARCEDHHGDLAHADAHVRQAIDRARAHNDSRLKFLETYLAGLEKRAPQLTVKLAAGSPSGARVLRDGIPLGDVALGLAVPVDVGHHLIEVSAGDAVKRYELDLAPGEHRTVEVAPPGPGADPDGPGALAASSSARTAARGPSSSPAAPATVAQPTTEPAPASPSSWSTRKSEAVGVAAAGAVGVIVGAVFGVRALSDRDDARSVAGCSTSGACTSNAALRQWNDDHDSWQHAALASTLGLAIGGAAVAGGVVLWLTAPSPEAHPAPSAWNLSLTPSSLHLTGTF